MDRQMRRFKQLLNETETAEIFKRGTSGVLSLLGDDDYPYGVPISYVYSDGKIYFHSAKSGHKVDAINKNGKASFCVIDKDQIIAEEYTTYFRSAIAFGKVKILTDDGERRGAIEKLAAKYSPEYEEGRLAEINQEFKNLCMIELDIEKMTGKEAIELVRAKEAGKGDK